MTQKQKESIELLDMLSAVYREYINDSLSLLQEELKKQILADKELLQ